MTLFFVSTGAILLALCSGISSQELTEPVKIPEPFKISPADFFKSHLVQPGFVHQTRDCARSGRILQVTHSHCPTNYPSVCATAVNKLATAEIFFVPTEDVNGVVTRISISTHDGKSKTFDFSMADTNLIAGQPYVLSGSGNSEKELLGREFTAKFEILKESDKSIQACAEIDLLAYLDERSESKNKKT